jgi:hypothetical protein
MMGKSERSQPSASTSLSNLCAIFYWHSLSPKQFTVSPLSLAYSAPILPRSTASFSNNGFLPRLPAVQNFLPQHANCSPVLTAKHRFSGEEEEEEEEAKEVCRASARSSRVWWDRPRSQGKAQF